MKFYGECDIRHLSGMSTSRQLDLIHLSMSALAILHRPTKWPSNKASLAIGNPPLQALIEPLPFVALCGMRHRSGESQPIRNPLRLDDCAVQWNTKGCESVYRLTHSRTYSIEFTGCIHNRFDWSRRAHGASLEIAG